MRVLICHERFLFRYGADRVFMLIAAQLRAQGHHLTMLAARHESGPLAGCADEVVTMPIPRDYLRSDEFCSRWLRRYFLPRARAAGGYDLIIHGGWPLFGATADLRTLAPRVLFLDHGVVPAAGYPPAQQAVLAKLRQLRRAHLAQCTHAVGVSRFIVETQTRPDTGGALPVTVILNGTDHLATTTPAAPSPLLEQVRQLHHAGHPLLLGLGRFESGTYKNSQAAVDVFQFVRSACPKARLLVLETAENLRLPESAAVNVLPLGYPDDATLAEIIRLVHVGLTTSLWEGFNLPLAELLRAGTPALALRTGAHAEVVPDSWFLCTDPAEMAAKALTIVTDPAPARARLTGAAATAHWDQLTWPRFVARLLDFLETAAPHRGRTAS